MSIKLKKVVQSYYQYHYSSKAKCLRSAPNPLNKGGHSQNRFDVDPSQKS